MFLQKIIITSIVSLMANSVYGYSGELTAYGAAPENQFCGFKKESWDYNNMMTAAINAPMMENSLACGLCAAIDYNGKTNIVMIDNICPECKYGDLDLSLQAWEKIIGNKNYARLKANWEFIDCDSFLLKDIKNVILKSYSINYWWLAITPSNMRCGVSNIEISFDNEKWIAMERDNGKMNGLYFVFHGHVEGKFKFRITSRLGDTIETEWYSEIKEIFDTKKQFECKKEIDCDMKLENLKQEEQPVCECKRNLRT